MFSCIVIYLIALAGLCLASWEVIRREMRNRLILTPFLLYCANEVVRVWPAGLYARYTGISEDAHVTLVLVTPTFAFLAGYALFRFSGNGRTRMPVDYWSRRMTAAVPSNHLLAIFLCAVLLVAGGFYLFRGVPPGFTGLLKVVTTGLDSALANVAGEQRLLLTKGQYFGGEYRGQGMIRALLFVGWPLLASTSLLIYMQRRTRTWLVLTSLTAFACLVYVSGDGTRGPVVWAMISIVFVASLQSRVRLRNVALVGAMLLLFVFGLSSVKKFSGAADRGQLVEEGVLRLTERIFVGNGINTVHVIELIRAGRLEMRYGSIHGGEILNALPTVRASVPFAYELFTLVKPEAKEDATTLASMTYLGKLYGDFGWAGCLIGSFVIGWVLAIASNLLLSLRKTVLNTALVGLVFMQLGRANLCGFTPLISYFVVLAVLYVFYVVCLSFGATYAASSVGPTAAPRAFRVHS